LVVDNISETSATELMLVTGFYAANDVTHFTHFSSQHTGICSVVGYLQIRVLSEFSN